MRALIIIGTFTAFCISGIQSCVAQSGLYSKDSIRYTKDSFYEFIEDRFTYCTDAYNDIYGQFCVSGNYVVKEDSIYFSVKKIETRELGSLHRIAPCSTGSELVMLNDTVAQKRDRPSSSNYWAMSTSKAQITYLNDAITFTAHFRIFNCNRYDEFIEIDGDRFYLNDTGLKE